MSSPRIAYLLKKFPRLSETFVLNEILEQERRGTEVHVFSRRKRDPEPDHPELARLRAEVEVLPHRSSLNPWRELFASTTDRRRVLGSIERVLRDDERWNHPRLPELLGEALLLRRRTAELGIDHVHVHFATDSAVTAMLLSRLGGPTYSVTLHAKDIYRSAVDPRLLDALIGESAFSVTVCDANVRYLAERIGGESLARLRRLYNGIDLSSFERSAGARDERHVLAVGRFVEKKGFSVLLDALALLRDRGVEARTTLVGDGEERGALEARLDELDLGERVHLTGALDTDGVRAHMARATVFCLPCVVGADGNRDALPTVLIEAQAAGLPVVSTPVTGIPEILGDGQAGVIVPEHDAAATADALEALLGDPERRRRLAEAGRERARRLFDLERSGDALSSWFEEAARQAACA
jgi:glycosyltransferase involved in cell wall biosynthesis